MNDKQEAKKTVFIECELSLTQSEYLDMCEEIKRQSADDVKVVLLHKGFHVVHPVKLNDIYRVICARRDVVWCIYQSNKKMDPSGPDTKRMFHEWLTLDSIARLFTDPVELETIKEIYHLNEED